MRVLARVGASLLIFIGLVAIAAAIGTMKFIGRENTIRMDPRTITTAGPAITTGRGLLSYYDTTLRVRVVAEDPKEKLWIGVAHQDDLSSYVADRSRAEIISYQYPDRLGLNNFTGVDNDLTAPTGLDWWVASAKGTGTAELSWPMQNAAYGAVIMNQNGHRKIAAKVSFGLQIKGVFETAEWAGLGGLIAVLLGIGIFIVSRKRRLPEGPDPDSAPPSPLQPSTSDDAQESATPTLAPEADR